MKWFQEQFAKSNIISGLLAIGIWAAIIYMAIAGLTIPDILYAGGISILSFFVGAKKGESEGINRALKTLGYVEREL